MYKKRFLSLILMAILLVSGLSLTASADTVSTSALGLLSSNTARAEILSDSILLINHPTDSRYYLSSTALISALSSSEGYELSYCNLQKEAATASIANSGYVKAVKDSEEVYVPIVTKELVAGKYLDFDNQSLGTLLSASEGLTPSYVDGLAGKDAGDYAVAIDTSTLDPAAGGFIQQTENVAGNVYTFEISFYHDSDASLHIKTTTKAGSASSIISDALIYNGDATATLLHYNNGNKQTSIGTLAKKRWHRIAISIDYLRNRILTYVDGVKTADYLAGIQIGYFQNLKFEVVPADAGQTPTGIIAFDDFIRYKGYYHSAYDTVANTHAAPKAVISGDVIYYDSAITSPQQLTEAIASDTDAVSAKVFTDSTLSSEALQLENENVVVVTAKNGLTVRYFTISDLASLKADRMYVENDFEGAIAADSAPGNGIKLQIYRDYSVTAYTSGTEGGLGGKPAENKAFIIESTGCSGLDASYNQPQLDLSSSSGYSGVVTAEVSVYADSYDVPMLLRLVYINDSGANAELQVNLNTSGKILVGSTETGIRYQPKRWYRIAITIDTTLNIGMVYVNGNLVNQQTVPAKTVATRFVTASVYSPTNTNGPHVGLHAYDDYRIYGTYYSPDDDKTALASNAEVQVNTAVSTVGKTAHVKGLAGMTAGDCMQLLDTTADITIFSDATLSDKLDLAAAVSDGAVAVLTSASGEAYDYYTLYRAIELTYSLSGQTLSVTAELPSTIGENVFVVLAGYDGNRMVYVDMQSVSSEQLAGSVELSVDYEQGLSYSAMIWTDNMAPVEYKEYE